MLIWTTSQHMASTVSSTLQMKELELKVIKLALGEIWDLNPSLPLFQGPAPNYRAKSSPVYINVDYS